MIDFVLNNVLITTAIISLFGVSFAAILNYRCNIKVNKTKIEHEERKIRQSFLTYSFKILRDAAKELREMKIYGDEKKAFELMAEYNNRAKDIFDSIKPFISKEKKDKLEKQYVDIQEKMSAIQIKSMTNKVHTFNKLSNDDIEIARDVAIKETHLRHELSRIIDIEISTIADKLKKIEL
ncbi:hypothetical protein [Rikenella microfusus]